MGEGAATSPSLFLSSELPHLPGQVGHMQGLQAVLLPWGLIGVSCRGQRSDPKGLINSHNSLGESLSLAQGCANSNAAAEGSGIIFRSS